MRLQIITIREIDSVDDAKKYAEWMVAQGIFTDAMVKEFTDTGKTEFVTRDATTTYELVPL